MRGWPVADNHVVMTFFRGLLRERKGIFFWLILLNALAAGTALVVPRLLGNLVDRIVEGGRQAAQLSSLNHLALVIVGVVCTQALLTFLAQGTSTIFGQDLLASAREYIVRTVLRLPLGYRRMSTNTMVPAAALPRWSRSTRTPVRRAVRAAGPSPWTSPCRRWPVTLACWPGGGRRLRRRQGVRPEPLAGRGHAGPHPGPGRRGGCGNSPRRRRRRSSAWRSRRLVEAVVRDLNLPVSPQALDRNLRVNKPVNADAVSLVLEWPDPEVAAAIVNGLMAGGPRGGGIARGGEGPADRAAVRAGGPPQGGRGPAGGLPGLPPGVSPPTRVRTSWRSRPRTPPRSGGQLNTVREKLNAQKATIDRLAARERAWRTRFRAVPRSASTATT